MTGLIEWLKKEPTVVTQTAQAILGALVAFGVLGFTEVQAGAILAAIAAVVGVINGLATRPFQWSLITGVVQALLILLAEFGLKMAENQVAAVYMVVALIGTVVTRSLVTPEVKMPPIAPTPTNADRRL